MVNLSVNQRDERGTGSPVRTVTLICLKRSDSVPGATFQSIKRVSNVMQLLRQLTRGSVFIQFVCYLQKRNGECGKVSEKKELKVCRTVKGSLLAQAHL